MNEIKISNRKTLLLLVMIVACLVLPMNAQDADGFIRDDMPNEYRESTPSYIIGTQPFGSDDYGDYIITTQQFGQDTPIGGGLLVLFVAGVGYAAMKRKRH